MSEQIQDVVAAKLAEMKEDFAKLGAEMKAAVAKEIEEKTKTGYADPETMEKIVKMEAKFRDLEQEILRPDRKHIPTTPVEKTFGSQLVENTDFQSWAKEDFGLRAGRRRMAFPMKGGLGLGLSQKAVITTGGLGSGTSGVLEQQRQSEFVRLPRQALRIRDLMRVRTMVGMNVDYLKQNVWTSAASPQTEGATKAESTLTYTTATATAKTIAHWLQVTRQALADMPELRADIDSQMLYGLKLKEESEILSGDGLGSHLNGIITQATAYSSGTYNVSGDTKLDKLRHAILQVRLALFPSDAVVLNPRDMHDIELIKDLNGGVRPSVNGNGTKTNGAQPTVKAHLPLDAQATDDAYVFTAYLPGVKPEEVELTFEKDVLTVRGQFPAKPESEKGWIKQELFHGPFERSLSFTTPVNSEAIEAHFDNGVLTLHVPKIEEAKPKKIAVIAK